MGDDGSSRSGGRARGKRGGMGSMPPSSAPPASNRREGRRSRGVGRKWVNRLKQWAAHDPVLSSLAHSVPRLHEYLVGHCWPRLEKWATVCLLLILALLDCFARGLTSLFRLTSAAVCLVLWCSILSLTVLAGPGWILLTTVAAAAVAFCAGITMGLALVAVFGALVVWMYGSFWTSSLILLVSGTLFLAGHTSFAGLVVLLNSMYSAKSHGGWLGLLVCAVLAFISSDLVVHILASTEQRKRHESRRRTAEGGAAAEAEAEAEAEADAASSSSANGFAADVSAPEEVARVLDCSDHYAVLGFARFDSCEESVVKREYRKKAMLVHPDKNKGNARAEEAFKCLQNAYEVLLDASKRKCYDEDLRREELMASLSQNGLSFGTQCVPAEWGCQDDGDEQEDVEGELGDVRPIVCKSCRQLHMWIPTDKAKQRARWCQDCEEYHPVKDGDGWVEQSCQSLLFGLFQKVNPPQAYVCAGGLVYDVTEWAICQGMKCPVNTHKPSFYVASNAGRRQGAEMRERAFYEWASRLFREQQQQPQTQPQQQPQPQPPSKASSRRKRRSSKK